MTTVAAAIMVRDGKVLIACRKKELANGGRWEFPGGKLEAGETARHCLKRELREEMGIEVTVAEKLGTGTHEDGPGSIDLIFYRADWIAGDLCLRDHSEIRWVSQRQLLDYDLTPADRRFAREYRWSDFLAAAIAAGAILLMQPLAWAQDSVPPQAPHAADQEALEKEAALNLYRLKQSIEKDGFYSARIALNIWRSTAIAADTFDPKLYDQLKGQLYDKAMADSLKCYQYFVQEKDYNNARICLLVWRSHAKETDRYDPEAYQKMQAGLEKLKDK